MESAAGLMNFIRTLSGAIATSVMTTYWTNETTHVHAELVGVTHQSDALSQAIQTSGEAGEQTRSLFDALLQSQSGMIATNQTFMMISAVFILAGSLIWLAPKVKKTSTEV